RIAQGESKTLELKRSTAELKRAGETLCAFLNGEGGKVLIGVGPNGELAGQEVGVVTLRDVAAMLGRLEPPARAEMTRVKVSNCREVIVLEAAASRQFAPFVFVSEAHPEKVRLRAGHAGAGPQMVPQRAEVLSEAWAA
ncbi:MAG: helix-turn-helix domain-containing protein, partial [Acidobacteriota bacterium]